MLFTIKYVLHVLVLPPASLVCLALAGLAVIRRRPRLGRGLLAVVVAALWLLSTPAVGIFLAHRVEPYPALDLARATGAGAVVVLGGGAQADAPEYDGGPQPGPVTLRRITYGAYAARRLGLPLLVSGADVESAGMTDVLERHYGVKPRWVDATARDTHDNARHSAALLGAAGIRSVVLVTSASHMRRAVHEFEAAGLLVTPAPTAFEPVIVDTTEQGLLGLLPTMRGLDRSEIALRELVGEAARPLMSAVHERVDRP